MGVQMKPKSEMSYAAQRILLAANPRKFVGRLAGQVGRSRTAEGLESLRKQIEALRLEPMVIAVLGGPVTAARLGVDAALYEAVRKAKPVLTGKAMLETTESLRLIHCEGMIFGWLQEGAEIILQHSDGASFPALERVGCFRVNDSRDVSVPILKRAKLLSFRLADDMDLRALRVVEQKCGATPFV
jgi:hypothetical protein